MKIRNPQVLLALILSFVLIVVFCKQQIPDKENLINTSCGVMVGNLGYGTGNFINNHKNPYVLTCKHVVEYESLIYTKSILLIQVKTDNELYSTSGKVVLYSKNLDFAIIEIDSLPIGGQITRYSYSESRIGDEIFCFGPPRGKPGKLFLFSGFMSQKNIQLGPIQRYDAGFIFMVPGTSGTTVFNKNGEGIGVFCRSSEPQSLFIPINLIRDALDNSGLIATHGILDGTCTNKLSKLHNGPIELP